MIFVFSIDPPFRWATADDRGNVQDRGIADDLAALSVPRGVSDVVAVAPAGDVTIRNVKLPARSRAKALAAVPYALEDTLATDVEQLYFQILDWKPGAETVVAIVAKDKMDAWHQAIRDLPFPVDALVPEYFFIPIHPQTEATVVRTQDDCVAVRTGPYQGFELDSASVDLWWRGFDRKDVAVACQDPDLARHLVTLGGTMVREWEIGSDFTDWLRHHQKFEITGNLLQGAYRPRHHEQKFGRYKIAAVILLVAAAIQFISSGYEYFELASASRRLDGEIRKVFMDTFPQTTRIVDPRVQFEQKVRELRTGTIGAGEFQILLSAVARVIPGSQGRLEEISFRDNAMIVTCVTKDFAGLDQLKTRFTEDSAVDVELLSSGSRDERVSGRFRISQARG